MDQEKNIMVAAWMVTYNQENYIAEAIEGVIKQCTTFTFKLFVGEDCSTDNTKKICLEYSQKFPDIVQIISTPINDIRQNSKNIYDACFSSGAKYIAMCEGDDYWTNENKLQKQVDFLEANPDYAICFHAVNILENEELRPSDLNLSAKEETYSILDLANSNLIHTPSVVFRNGLIEKFPGWFSQSPVGDYVLHLLNAKKGLIKYFPETMAVYRVHGGGTWGQHSVEVNHPKWLWLLNKLQGEEFNQDVLKKISAQRDRVFVEYIDALLRRKQYDLVKKAFNEFCKKDEDSTLLVDFFVQRISELNQTVEGITSRKMFKAGQKLSDLKYKYSSLFNRK